MVRICQYRNLRGSTGQHQGLWSPRHSWSSDRWEGKPSSLSKPEANAARIGIFDRRGPSPAGMEGSGIPLRVHRFVSFQQLEDAFVDHRVRIVHRLARREIAAVPANDILPGPN
jgi:hypothetical protein